MRKNFFYRLNNFLILAIILFAGGLVYAKLHTAQSQTSDTNVDPLGITSSPAYIINREVDVNLKPGSYTAVFKSDGISGKADKEQIAKFSGDSKYLQLIETPISYKLDKENTKLILPGEVVYPAIPKATAPVGYRCQPNSKTNTVDDPNCLHGVTQMSVFDTLQTSVITIGDRQFKVETTNSNIFDSIVNILKTAFNQGFGALIATDKGLSDQSRTTVGSIQYWGDDQFQQFVKINGEVVHNEEGTTSTTGVNQGEGLFASEFSRTLNSQIATSYKKANVIQASLKEIGGAGKVYDPFTSYEPRQSQSGYIQFSNALVQLVTQNNQKFNQAQKRLAAQVALRPIQEADTYGVKYNLCTALQQGKLPDAQVEYKNPVKKTTTFTVPDPITGQRFTKDKCTYTDTDGSTKDDPGCQMYERYERTNPVDKKCISAISARSTPERGLACALSVAKTGSCDDFSVEESDLHLEMIQKAFPIGLGAYFQNATLQNLDPKDTTGPYLNYLSPYFCAKLNIAYDITGNKDYIYDVSVQNPGVGGTVTNPNSKYVKTNVLNQYCVLGGVMSNFAWAITNQKNNFGTNVASTVINIPKEALTCDKKETAIFGATPIPSNINGADNLPYYIMDDNIRGDTKGNPKSFDGLSAQDEVALYQGYNSYPLTQIYNDPILKNAYPARYAKYDMYVVTDPISSKPKYIVGSFGINPTTLALVLCKLPGTDRSDSSYIKTSCKIIDEGAFVFPSGVGMKTQIVNDSEGKTYQVDSIVAVYRQPNLKSNTAVTQPTSKQYTSKKGDPPFVYRYVDVTDQTDINSAQLSDQFQLEYKHNVDVIQGSGGDIYIAGISLADKSITTLSVSKLSLALNNDTADISFNSNKIVSIKRKPTNKKLTTNLCDLNGNYCTQLANLAFTNKLSITQDSKTGALYAIIISGGLGVVYPVDPNGQTLNIPPYLFGYKMNSISSANDAEPDPHIDQTNPENSDEYDAISTMRVNAAGDLDLFLERSGIYLNVIMRKNLTGLQIDDINKKCGTNCLPVEEKHFDPHVFQTDCSDYDGSGACGYPKLGEIKAPIVKSFVYSNSGKILAWYTYLGLDKTLMQSPDLLYSFTGVYSRVALPAGTESGAPSKDEYSNYYLPTTDSTRYTAIRLRNFTSGGLLVGRDLQDKGGTITETDNYNPEKLNCMRIYANSVSGIDLYFGDNGLQRTELNPAGSASSPVRPVDSPTDPNASSSQNSGEYCEEKWCIPDEVEFVGGAQFGNDTNDDKLKNQIAQVTGRSRAFVDRMCKIASEKNVSCVVIAAIWISESSASTADDPSNPAFGCLLNSTSYCKGEGADTPYCKNWYTFDNQVQCSVNSLVNQYNSYQPNAVLTGPSDRRAIYETNANRGAGSCVVATRFSYVFQKYTPLDRRINNDNQCNKGIVVRGIDGNNPQNVYCSGNVPATAAYNSSGKVALPEVWPEATQTRIALQNSILKMDINNDLKADNTLCFPNKNQTPDNSTNNQDISKVIADYDTSTYTSQTGIFYMNLANWGNDAAAANVYMALKEDWDKNTPGVQNLSGAHIIKPGQSWSFNDQLNNLLDLPYRTDPKTGLDIVDLSSMENKYSQISPPWDSRKFDFSVPADQRTVGGGWCELATTIRMSVERVVGSDGKTLSSTTFSGTSGAPDPKPDKAYGTGSGWKGDITHWSHSGVTENTFNNKLAVGDYRLDKASKFVSILLRPSKPEGINDGDLVITNPYPDGSDVDMIITVQISESGKDAGLITVKTYFGKKRINTETGPR